MFDRRRRRATEIARQQLRLVVAELEARTLTGPDAVCLLDLFTEVERLAAAAKALCAARAAETNQWRGTDRSPAEWLARRTGTSTGAARRDLETGERVRSLPATDAALRAGRLSMDQASAVSDAASADRTAEDDLLRAAAREPLRQLRERAERVKAASLPDDEARHRAIHASRSLREHVGADGAWNLHVRHTKDVGARIMSRLRPFLDGELARARAEGRREGIDAYAADALAAMAEAAAGSGGSSIRRSASSAPASKVIVRVDLPVLQRGRVESADEVCEIAGYGPIPASVARRLLGESLLALVLTRGVDVCNVTHLGRNPTAFQQTALEWRDPTCRVEGCSRSVRLERDHRIEWAETRHTRLDELDRLCHFHHRLKTTKGYRLAPGSGKRPMVAPGAPGGARSGGAGRARSARPPPVG